MRLRPAVGLCVHGRALIADSLTQPVTLCLLEVRQFSYINGWRTL
jgi:hypothetical protein